MGEKTKKANAEGTNSNKKGAAAGKNVKKTPISEKQEANEGSRKHQETGSKKANTKTANSACKKDIDSSKKTNKHGKDKLKSAIGNKPPAKPAVKQAKGKGAKKGHDQDEISDGEGEFHEPASVADTDSNVGESEIPDSEAAAKSKKKKGKGKGKGKKGAKGKKEAKEDGAEGEEHDADTSSMATSKTGDEPVDSMPIVDHSSHDTSSNTNSSSSASSSVDPNSKSASHSDGSDEDNEDGSSDAEGRQESEQLESTKPTINQRIKQKKEKPINTAEKIGKAEFESLNDEVNELNSGVQTIKHSYGSIIKSLVNMQTRRTKRKVAKQNQEQKLTFLTTVSTMDPKQIEITKQTCLQSNEKYNMDNFLNPLVREETFQMLFAEVEDVNKSTERLRSFFDHRGNFMREKYDQSDYRIERKQFNEYKLWVKKLLTVVDEIARNYNDDLLNMFRLV